MRDPPNPCAVLKRLHHRIHFELADLPETDRALPDGGGGSGGGAASSGGDRLSRLSTTLPSNLTTSPPPRILSLSAVRVPFSSLTSTCSSEVTVLLPMSTSACDNRAS